MFDETRLLNKCWLLCYVIGRLWFERVEDVVFEVGGLLAGAFGFSEETLEKLLTGGVLCDCRHVVEQKVDDLPKLCVWRFFDACLLRVCWWLNKNGEAAHWKVADGIPFNWACFALIANPVFGEQVGVIVYEPKVWRHGRGKMCCFKYGVLREVSLCLVCVTEGGQDCEGQYFGEI